MRRPRAGLRLAAGRHANVPVMRLIPLCLILSSALAAQQPTPPAEKPQTGTVKVDPADLPVSLDRIQRALAKLDHRIVP